MVLCMVMVTGMVICMMPCMLTHGYRCAALPMHASRSSLHIHLCLGSRTELCLRVAVGRLVCSYPLHPSLAPTQPGSESKHATCRMQTQPPTPIYREGGHSRGAPDAGVIGDVTAAPRWWGLGLRGQGSNSNQERKHGAFGRGAFLGHIP